MKTTQKTKAPVYWFKAKRYGYGWVPATWQGWLIMLLYIIAILLSVYMTSLVQELDQSSPVAVTSLFCLVFVYTIALVYICYLTGEKPRWRWGGK